MPHKPLLALYSGAHFWVDLSCALLLVRTLSGEGEFSFCLLIYNFCAFALQMPLGLLADRLDRNGAAAAAGCGLAALAYVCPAPLLTAAMAGVGNALFHLGGGVDTLNISGNRAAALGVFVSPGALGLWLGTRWGQEGFPLWPGALGLAVLGLAILLLSRKSFGSLRSGNAPMELPGSFGPMLPLFLVVVLRSYMGLNQQFPWRGTGPWALVLTLALVLGKAAGGFLADGLGSRRAAAASLGPAAALYLLSAAPLPGTLAVFLFNMTMPVTLWKAAQLAPGAKGFAFGLLTFALFLGYLPSWMGWPSRLADPWACAAAALVSLALLWPPLGERRTAQC